MTAGPAHLRYPALDWQRVFEGAPDDVDWLVPDFLACGQSYPLVAATKDGKSLLMQDVAAALSAGRSALGNPAAPPVTVLYVDLENTRDDLTERMRDMGYGPDDLARLRYLSFPSLPPLGHSRWRAGVGGAGRLQTPSTTAWKLAAAGGPQRASCRCRSPKPLSTPLPPSSVNPFRTHP